ncbi:IMV membrane protein, entry/fusion [Eptesipox virus]|uniref:IMV membrane protein, entry/fusion n=1 Tax=Eptesipox virus TaxID=1329402 RepID=A0A220T6D7_9POXV|nr:IMV membrane protein, entry/fusion [Eptesipox virus]ASK51275.1 IMV membrane protein, entry/fusion [Eptesipox virus]WAH71033.1 IMV membrane protein, entry/fusion [Eptesipox virus]
MLTDEEIYNYCDNNKNDIRCKCIYPDQSIIKIGTETRLPYYCWYEPCKRSDALLTQVLKKNISKCNISDCVVSLGNVSIKNGVLDVRNTCGSNITFTNELVTTKYLNQEIQYFVLHPRWFPICLLFLVGLCLVIN